MVVLGFFATYSARNSVTAIATRFLSFKAESVVDYVDGQWQLLVQNDMTENTSLVDAIGTAVETYSRNTIRQNSELIFAVDDAGDIVFATSQTELGPDEKRAILKLSNESFTGWNKLKVGGVSRIAQVRNVDTLGWSVFATDTADSFYRDINLIIVQSATILGITLITAVILLFYLSALITRPLKSMVATMTGVIETNDLARRVEVLYRDETGTLGHTFNIMIGELEKAYGHIKRYALRSAVSTMNERKIRNIFQKYVPKDIIDRFFEDPESMLAGENRILSVVFSDIRDFTSLSERLSPETIVDSLNQYFSIMVDLIIQRNGIVDKYIGDAIMAFFGAPVSRDDDAYQSVCASLDMIDGLELFNDWQIKRERPRFRIGIGISFGPVTIGNIGSEKKMDYTVIGDMVNLASRLQDLTKVYGVPIIISESVHKEVQKSIACRLLDRVVVKGRSIAGGIYGVARELNESEDEAWRQHHEAMVMYYKRDFKGAIKSFEQVDSLLTSDKVSKNMIVRCEKLLKNPPGKDWSGIIEMTTK